MHALQPITARPSSITTLDGSNLDYVDNYKYLGVWLDCKLSFETHIKHLQSKIKSRIGFLFCNKASFTHAAKRTLVNLTILPIQFSAANDWNELQKSLKLETHVSITSFKHWLSEQLTDHCTCT